MGLEQKGAPEGEVQEGSKGATLEETSEVEIAQEEAAEEVAIAIGGITTPTTITQEAKIVTQTTIDLYKTGIQRTLE